MNEKQLDKVARQALRVFTREYKIGVHWEDHRQALDSILLGDLEFPTDQAEIKKYFMKRVKAIQIVEIVYKELNQGWRLGFDKQTKTCKYHEFNVSKNRAHLNICFVCRAKYGPRRSTEVCLECSQINSQFSC